MSRIVEKIYYAMPWYIQNVLVSLMGLKLRKERYNSTGLNRLESLRDSRIKSVSEMQELQSDLFVEFARHAIKYVPYYQAWARENGVKPEVIRSLRDIDIFPVIGKSLLRENPELFKAEVPNNNHGIVLSTSGTTGTPLTVFTDLDSRSSHYAFFTRLREWYGVGIRDKRATFFGRIIMLQTDQSAPFWRYDLFQNNLLFSSYHLNKKNLNAYYEKLVEYNPAEIFAYPSSITRLAQYIVENGLPKIKLKLLMTTAEHLYEGQRRLLESAFDAPIVNQYGCTEMAFFASTLPSGDFAFHPEHGYVEVITEDNDLQEQGSGRLVATGFVNRSMPVIRYEVGDVVTLGARNDKGYQTILSVEGRKDDYVYTRDGTPVGRLDPIFKGGHGVRFAQIHQKVSGDILVRIVPDDFYSSEDGDSLRRELIKRIGDELTIEIELVAEIEKSKNGKFRPVISEYRANANSF